jgi:hypothetical protein
MWEKKYYYHFRIQFMYRFMYVILADLFSPFSDRYRTACGMWQKFLFAENWMTFCGKTSYGMFQKQMEIFHQVFFIHEHFLLKILKNAHKTQNLEFSSKYQKPKFLSKF